MLNVVADGFIEDVEYHLTYDEKEETKCNITKWPTILKGIGDEKDLHDDVDEDANCIDDVEDDEKSSGIGWR